jgi:hypothetical protein
MSIDVTNLMPFVQRQTLIFCLFALQHENLPAFSAAAPENQHEIKLGAIGSE